MEKITVIEYCPKCDRNTPHEPVDDAVFEYAIRCSICNTVWESDNPIGDEDDDE